MADLPEQIRAAIERAEFRRAGELWLEWSGRLAGQLQGESAAEADWARYQELYRWGRNVLLAERAQLSRSLNSLHAARVYVAASEWASGSMVRGSF